MCSSDAVHTWVCSCSEAKQALVCGLAAATHAQCILSGRLAGRHSLCSSCAWARSSHAVLLLLLVLHLLHLLHGHGRKCRGRNC